MPRPTASTLLCSAALGLTGCSPALDWREFVPEGSGVGVNFPCQPDRHERTVTLAGTRMPMRMLVCTADATTFALSHVDVAEPAGVAPVLSELRALAIGNVQGSVPRSAPFELRGATPNPMAGRLQVTGRLPDGQVVQEHAAFFVRGLRVYQATVIGAQPAAQAVEGFISGLKFPA